MFKRLIIKEWRQFSDIDITFHPHLTVLTGANGAGKTTLLNLLADHFGWGLQFVSSYAKDKETGSYKYSNSIHRLGEKIKKMFIKKSVEPESITKYQIGEIQYKNDVIGSLVLPDSVFTSHGGKCEWNERAIFLQKVLEIKNIKL